jgi:hypothetical protein
LFAIEIVVFYFVTRIDLFINPFNSVSFIAALQTKFKGIVH